MRYVYKIRSHKIAKDLLFCVLIDTVFCLEIVAPNVYSELETPGKIDNISIELIILY